ncbi:MAG: hypothetical protein COV91_05875 [Candidatus Taylorbacteria bacterium CG11_big_fil_rev_8_21_14_0_20_46_11]|uniref:Uncharacterized protein n=1 Tax=Candidatus Taylorbacteria bacterium CG11_big_fil_rev_8_21_14_0_20_46_11 TaxID=1975025 RepID=A0A2H0KA26_9BACT|nr:MAG: hypothetical protein COV91_05875 [Candidatus Taylorbacteria bacterium CG11_big_fil_rev_8_21_14_0_20_46_11]
MKFVAIYCKPATVPQSASAEARSNPPPDLATMENVHRTIIPSIQSFGPFQAVCAPPNMNCLAVASIFYRTFRLRALSIRDDLEEVEGRTIDDIQNTTALLIRSIGDLYQSAVLVVPPTVLACFHYMADYECAPESIEPMAGEIMNRAFELEVYEYTNGVLRIIA